MAEKPLLKYVYAFKMPDLVRYEIAEIYKHLHLDLIWHVLEWITWSYSTCPYTQRRLTNHAMEGGMTDAAPGDAAWVHLGQRSKPGIPGDLVREQGWEQMMQSVMR